MGAIWERHVRCEVRVGTEGRMSSCAVRPNGTAVLKKRVSECWMVEAERSVQG